MKAETLYTNHIFSKSSDTYCVLTTQENLKLELHNHDFYEIFIILSGHVTHCINGTKELLDAGSISFIYPWDTHGYEFPTPELKMLNIAVRAGCMEALLQYINEPLPRRGICEASFILSVEHLMQLHAIKNVVFKLVQQLIQNRADMPAPAWLKRLHEELKEPEHFAAGMEYVKCAASKSAAHISREFRRRYGMTLIAYITSLRLDYAQLLLRSGKDSVLDISLRCGFYSVSHFNHIFKHHFHMTPTQYRNANFMSI